MLPTEQIKILTAFRSEQEAAMLVAALADAGIEARMSGSFSSGFRAEAPGVVQVLVQSSDMQKAEKILEECQPRQLIKESKQPEQTPEEDYPKNRLVFRTMIVVVIVFIVWGLLKLLYIL